jgi:hypothetical protein
MLNDLKSIKYKKKIFPLMVFSVMIYLAIYEGEYNETYF